MSFHCKFTCSHCLLRVTKLHYFIQITCRTLTTIRKNSKQLYLTRNSDTYNVHLYLQKTFVAIIPRSRKSRRSQEFLLFQISEQFAMKHNIKKKTVSLIVYRRPLHIVSTRDSRLSVLIRYGLLSSVVLSSPFVFP